MATTHCEERGSDRAGRGFYGQGFLLSSLKLLLSVSFQFRAEGVALCGTAAAGGGCLSVRQENKINQEKNHSTESFVTGQTDISHAADVCHSDRGFRQKTEWVKGILEHVVVR